MWSTHEFNGLLITQQSSAKYPHILTFIIRRDEPEYILVSQHHGLVDLSLPEPGALLPRGEDLDGDVLAPPAAAPHLAEAALADDVHQLDLTSDGALH